MRAWPPMLGSASDAIFLLVHSFEAISISPPPSPVPFQSYDAGEQFVMTSLQWSCPGRGQDDRGEGGVVRVHVLLASMQLSTPRSGRS